MTLSGDVHRLETSYSVVMSNAANCRIPPVNLQMYEKQMSIFSIHFLTIVVAAPVFLISEDASFPL